MNNPNYPIIDAHSHLWLTQDTTVNGKRIKSLKNGRSIFMDEEVQMMPPFMTEGQNTAEIFLSNMDYAQVGGAVVIQEIIDGNQDCYLSEVQRTYPDRFCCMSLCDVGDVDALLRDVTASGVAAKEKGLRGVAIPAHRLEGSLLSLMPLFEYMEKNGLLLSICLKSTDQQVHDMEEILQSLPNLKVAVGHFGMADQPNLSTFLSSPSEEERIWRRTVRLCSINDNVRLETGGITWLFHPEFYPYPTAAKAIREAMDMVGANKLMWGSDYPRTITAITYRMSYDFITKSVLFSEEEKAAILGGNAMDFYSFGNIPTLPYIKNMSE